MSLIVKRKRMMDSVGHYARPDILRLIHDDRPHAHVTRLADVQERQAPTTSQESRFDGSLIADPPVRYPGAA
jgi:aliphatic nitrilase